MSDVVRIVCLSEDLGLWVDPSRIEAIVDGTGFTTVCLRSGQEIKVHGLTAGTVLDRIEELIPESST